jgi:hypothetical protein
MLSFSFLLVLIYAHSTSAYPHRAGTCKSGPAVGGAHLSENRTVTLGALSKFGYQVSIDGILLDPNSETTISTVTDHSVTLAATDKEFRGFLMRLHVLGADGPVVDALLPLDHSWTEDTCDRNVVGITHYNSNLKPFASGLLRLEKPVRMVLDVTVVKKLNDEKSVYGYNSFDIIAINGTNLELQFR